METASCLSNIANCKPTRKIVILGASGSIGQTALAFLKETVQIEVVGISVHTSLQFLSAQLRQRHIAHVAVSAPGMEEAIGDIGSHFGHSRFYAGREGLLDLVTNCAASGADTVLVAIVGADGIEATLHALKLGLKVALANKEVLVTAGPAIRAFLRKNAERSGGSSAVILPVDSEHNAVFQLLNNLRLDHLRRVILTASGGPFYDRSPQELKNVSREEVLNHPTWSMGAKISVDSAGMINKGLELIEAHFLFDLPYEQLLVLIHRQSLAHAMVELRDGAYMIHASHPDMTFPIAHALYFPDPVPVVHRTATLPFEWEAMRFRQVSASSFPGFLLCLQAAQTGGTAPAIFNAANEMAVKFFLEGQIGFTTIPDIIKGVLNSSKIEAGEELELFLTADREARKMAYRQIVGENLPH